MTPQHWHQLADRILERYGENTYRDFIADVDCYVQDWVREVTPGLLVEMTGAVDERYAARNDYERKLVAAE